MAPATTAAGGLAETALVADFPSEEIARKRTAVYAEILAASKYLDCADFTRFHPDDVRLLVEVTDRTFTGGCIGRALGDTPLTFRLSPRMTNAAGKLTSLARRTMTGERSIGAFEIAVSSLLVFEGGRQNGGRTAATVVGVECNDRLEILQRVVEHEMVHLIEMLLFAQSSCNGARFQSMAGRLFGHRAHKHALVTPRERAFTEHGVRVGDRVRFRFADGALEGVIARIARRATVLVARDTGRRDRFLVPIPMLERVH